jgi:hypothetical protein
MSNLENFNKTLKNLDIEVNKLSAISTAYQKFEDTLTATNKLISEIKKYTGDIEKLKKEQKEHHKIIQEYLEIIDESNVKSRNELRKVLDDKTDLIRQENRKSFIDLDGVLKVNLSNNLLNIKQLIDDLKNKSENENLKLKEAFNIESKNIIINYKKEMDKVKVYLLIIGLLQVTILIYLVLN